ncbi:MAG: SDR family oxidoreductase [Actinobacteria bacterium]|nr:MAG: SDR family oxidoreductase [Actinomycetota bacterium]
MRGLKGKGVLITGGTSGIGEAAARRFLEEGSRVFVCGRDAGKLRIALDSLRDMGEIDGIACDVSRDADVLRLIGEAEQALERIDVLINNAGISWREPFLEITPEHWDEIIAVNLRGVFPVAQEAARRMMPGGGVIVNMSSTNGFGGEEDYAHYNASKAGIILLTRTMAVELGPHGIRVNAICPGYIRTPLNETIAGAIGGEEFVAAYERDRIPLGRAGTPEEVASAYAFLASDEAAFIHGEALVVDGGQLAIM